MQTSGILHKDIIDMLAITDGIPHLPRKIPDAIYYGDADSSEIANNSSLQDLKDVIYYFENYFSYKDKMAIISLLSLRSVNCFDVMKYLLAWSRNKIASWNQL
jgi:hypothetical protein